MPDQPPYRAYSTIAATFMAGLGAVNGVAAARKRPLREMAAGAVNDFLLAAFGALTAKANEVEQRAGGAD